MRRPTNPLALAVLTLLWEKPMHPYEMSATLRERNKHASVRLNYGSLYAVVDSLAKRGCVREVETVREGRRPARTVFGITDEGLELLHEWLGDLVRRPTPQFTDFEAALSLIGALPPTEALELLHERMDRLRAEIDDVRALLAGGPDALPRFFVIEAEYAQHMRRAELDFVAGLVTDLESGAVGGLHFWKQLHGLREPGSAEGDSDLGG